LSALYVTTVPFLLKLAALPASGAAYMKLRQSGIVPLLIRPAVLSAGGHAYMKLLCKSFGPVLKLAIVGFRFAQSNWQTVGWVE
jgi:hypothetical protein